MHPNSNLNPNPNPIAHSVDLLFVWSFYFRHFLGSLAKLRPFPSPGPITSPNFNFPFLVSLQSRDLQTPIAGTNKSIRLVTNLVNLTSCPCNLVGPGLVTFFFGARQPRLSPSLRAQTVSGLPAGYCVADIPFPPFSHLSSIPPTARGVHDNWVRKTTSPPPSMPSTLLVGCSCPVSGH